MKKTFEQWMHAVDAALVRRLGVESADLPDCCYADWHADGMSAGCAARKAARMADGEDD